jgi:hypothetical protein
MKTLATPILKTTDYDLFSSFTSNREIDQKHVAQLVKSIQKKDLLYMRPILVDHEMRIIDGQHRLEGARILGVPIYYLVSETITKLDISFLNSNQKNWSMMNYIDYYTIEGKTEFLKLSKFLATYPHIKISAALSMVSGSGARNTARIKDGELNIDNLSFGHTVAEALAVLNKKYQHLWIYDSRFPVALAKAMGDPCFSLDTFIKRIDLNPRAFVRTTTAKESAKMIEEIYNYRTSVNQIKVA